MDKFWTFVTLLLDLFCKILLELVGILENPGTSGIPSYSVGGLLLKRKTEEIILIYNIIAIRTTFCIFEK